MQVLTSAAQIDRAIEDGLTPTQMSLLAEARALWHGSGRMPPVHGGLAVAVQMPAALDWDAVFTTTARRKLSDPRRSVSP